MIQSLDVVMLFVTGLLCWVGVFSKAFHDNFLQRIGLAILAIASWGRGYVVFQFGVGNEIYVWYHAGCFFFAIGTWWKFSLRIMLSTVMDWRGYIPYDRRTHK